MDHNHVLTWQLVSLGEGQWRCEHCGLVYEVNTECLAWTDFNGDHRMVAHDDDQQEFWRAVLGPDPSVESL